MRLVLSLIAVLLFSFRPPAGAVTLEELAARITALEQRNAQLEREVQTLRGTNVAGSPAASSPSSRAADAGTAQPEAAAASTGGTGTGAEAQLGKELKSINFDRPLAAAPAFVALDVSPETVVSPSTPREFAASLLNGVNREGKLQSGLALEAAPYQVFRGKQTTLEEYQGSYLTRLLYNFSLSIATTKAAEDDDTSQRLALGFSFSLFDNGDPRMDPAVAMLFHRVNREVPPYRPSRAGMSPAEMEAEATAHYEGRADPNAIFVSGLKEIEGIRAQSWGRSSWNVAWAPTWVTPSGNADDLVYEGSVAWTTFALGFERTPLQGRMQLLGHVRFREREIITDPDDSSRSADRDTLFAAARLRWGRADLNFSGELGYLRYWGGLDGDREAVRIGAALEKRLSENVWLVISAGEQLQGGDSGDELFALGALRFGAADSPNFAR